MDKNIIIMILDILKEKLSEDDFNDTETDIISGVIASVLDEHKEEIIKLYEVYGPKTLEIILQMFSDPESGADKYYDAIQGKSAGDLLDEGFENLRDARKKGEDFKSFLNNVGLGAGIVIKALIKSVNPLG